MTRAHSYLDDNTRTFARTCPGFGKTQAQMAVAIHVYRKPLAERVAMWLFKYGWALVLLAVFLLSGCIGPDDADTAILIAQDLQEAVQQAKDEQ